MFLFFLVFAMFCARLFICALWSPAGKGLTSWLSFVVSSVSLSLSHWYPGSGVVLDCIDSWSLHHYLLSIGLCKTCGPLGQDHFRPQDHNLNKLGRGPLVLVMLHTKYQSSMPCGFRQEDFLCFPYRSLCITCNPRDRPIYGPWA